MATADKLTYLNTTKLLLRDAIRRAGHYLPDAATFRSYPYAMLPDESSLSLDFVRGEYVAHNWRDGTVSRAGLSNIMTTTRASGGGYFDHLGVYQWAANNTPRIDHDPATLSTSTTSATLAAGAVTLAVTVTYTVGSYVRATHDGSNWMAGRVTASTGSSVTIWVDRVVGSGTYASWTVIRVLGLLVEESRTNLLTRSSDFANAAWGKENGTWTSSADSRFGTVGVFTENSATGGRVTGRTMALTAGTVYSHTEIMKAVGRDIVRLQISSGGNTVAADFYLSTGTLLGVNGGTASIVGLGDGWYACTATLSVSVNQSYIVRFYPIVSGSATYTGDGRVAFLNAGAQLEAGAFPTSYIPTTAAQVTRAADQCVVSNLADWYRGDEGTLVARWVTDHNANDCYIVSTTDGSTANVALMRQITGRMVRAAVASGGVAQAAGNGPPSALGATVRSALVLKKDNFQYAQDGAIGWTDTSGNMPVGLSDLRIGRYTSPTIDYLSGHIESLQFIPRALSNTELQRITA